MHELSYSLITYLQQFRSDGADAFFSALSFVGTEDFFLILFPILYWVVDKRFTLRFALLFLLSSSLNAIFKIALAQPRPDPARVAVLAVEATNGLPSGHAQSAVTTWGYLAYSYRRRWAVMGLVFLIFGISLSRLYLGVHFIGDVLGGWLIGLVLLFGFIRIAPAIGAWSHRQPLWVPLLITAILPFLLLVLPPLETLPRAIGAATGALWGCIADFSRLRFQEKGATRVQMVLRLLIGMLVLLLIWRGLKPFLDTFGMVGVLVRYTLLGAWLTGGAPLLFVRLGLAQRETMVGIAEKQP
jgi:membrane-associated phospholipid phosphatase